jgi:hypothetical protein
MLASFRDVPTMMGQPITLDVVSCDASRNAKMTCDLTNRHAGYGEQFTEFVFG